MILSGCQAIGKTISLIVENEDKTRGYNVEVLIETKGRNSFEEKFELGPDETIEREDILPGNMVPYHTKVTLANGISETRSIDVHQMQGIRITINNPQDVVISASAP